MIEYVELWSLIIACGLAGYAIGRTIVSESIFEELTDWLKTKLYFDVPPDALQDSSGAIFRQVTREDDTVDIEVLSEDGYRTDVPRPIAFILGKIGDLLDCEICASTQAAFQLYLWAVVLSVLSPSVVYLGAAVGVAYLALSYIN